jgi:hypothetical protein
MSSSKAAVARRTKAPARRTAKSAPKVQAKPALKIAAGGASDDAERLAGALEKALTDGRLDALTPEALQALFAALCKLYSANVEQGAPYLPVNTRSGVTPTDVMVVASKLLRATNLQVFELGMWQSWTGR